MYFNFFFQQSVYNLLHDVNSLQINVTEYIARFTTFDNLYIPRLDSTSFKFEVCLMAMLTKPIVSNNLATTSYILMLFFQYILWNFLCLVM